MHVAITNLIINFVTKFDQNGVSTSMLGEHFSGQLNLVTIAVVWPWGTVLWPWGTVMWSCKNVAAARKQHWLRITSRAKWSAGEAKWSALGSKWSAS